MQHPEKVSAFIGVGQCIIEADSYADKYAYADAKRIATERGDDTTKMDAAYEAFCSDEQALANLQALRRAVEVYHPQTDTTDAATIPALTSPIIGVDDAKWFFFEMSTLFGNKGFEKLEKPLYDYLNGFNLYDCEEEFQVPVLFISGSCDWACPAGLVKEYANKYNYKYVEFEGCGHSPQEQHPEEFANVIKDFLN
jgi:pimeloyl-ACP methyl ester carboxylesterase